MSKYQRNVATLCLILPHYGFLLSRHCDCLGEKISRAKPPLPTHHKLERKDIFDCSIRLWESSHEEALFANKNIIPTAGRWAPFWKHRLDNKPLDVHLQG